MVMFFPPSNPVPIVSSRRHGRARPGHPRLHPTFVIPAGARSAESRDRHRLHRDPIPDNRFAISGMTREANRGCRYAAAGLLTMATLNRFATKAASVRLALPAGLAPVTWKSLKAALWFT